MSSVAPYLKTQIGIYSCICEYLEEVEFMERRRDRLCIYIYVNILRKWRSWREEGLVCVIHSRSANKTIVVGL